MIGFGIRNRKNYSDRYKIILILVGLILFVIPALGNTCVNCHEKLKVFNETEVKFNELRVKHLSRDVTCSIDCHTDFLDKIAKSNYDQWTESKHALYNITCDNCHSGNNNSNNKEIAHAGILRSSNNNSSIYYKNIPEMCGRCHSRELEQFKNSMHYQRLKALEQAPTCDTCHSPHKFKILNTTQFSDVCDNCHNNVDKIAPEDAPERAIIALDHSTLLKKEIHKVNNSIKQINYQGKELSFRTQKDIEEAISIQNDLPMLWHRFDISMFEDRISNGISLVQEVEKELSIEENDDKEKEISKAPVKVAGFEISLTISMIIIIFLILRRKKKKII